MRIINVVEQLNGIISQILSYPVYEEQLVDDVHYEAEKMFMSIINEVKGIDPEDMDEYVEDGYYDDNAGWTVSLVWSETN